MLLPFDLHVLGTPPAFILSQDRTLNVNYCEVGLAADFRFQFLYLQNESGITVLLHFPIGNDVFLVYVLVIPFSFQRAIVSVRFFWRVKDSIILPIAVSTIFLVFFKKALS